MASGFSQWMFLPTEIRFNIINLAISKIPGNLAPFSVISRDWQVEVERRTFQKLKIRSSRMDSDFHRILEREWRKHAVRHIWLDIELPSYQSQCCSPHALPPLNNSPIVNHAICGLFRILDDWKPEKDLTLELNVLSPSDSQHWFRGLHFSTDHVEGDRNPVTSSAQRGPIVHHDPVHGLYNGSRFLQAPFHAVRRLFRPIRLSFQNALPSVPAITSLILRRQLRRSLSPFTLHLLLSSLNRLREITYEPWASYPESIVLGRNH